MDKFAFRKCLFRFFHETGLVSKIFLSVIYLSLFRKNISLPMHKVLNVGKYRFWLLFFFLMLTLIEITPAILLQPSIFFHVITAPSPQQHFSTSDEFDQKCEEEFLDVTPQRMSPFGKKIMHFYIF